MMQVMVVMSWMGWWNDAGEGGDELDGVVK